MTILVNLEMTYFYFTKDFDSEDGLNKLCRKTLPFTAEI